MPMNKPVLIALIWAIALLVSAGLRWWGRLSPLPLQPSWPVVLTIVLLPSLLMGAWILIPLLSAEAGGRRESGDCDQETH